MTVRETLPSGLRVIVRDLPSAPVVTLNLWIGSGSIDDPDGLGGASHFVEHMLFKGSASGRPDISRIVQAAGGYLNAATGCDHTTFYQVVPSDRWKEVLAAQATAASSPPFAEADVNTERSVILEEVKSGELDPVRFMWRRLMETAYESHPCRLPVAGTVESVAGLGGSTLREFHGRHYVAGNAVQVVVGDVRSDEVVAAVSEAYADIGGGSAPERNAAAEPGQEQMRALSMLGRLERSYVAMAFHVPDVLHDDMPVLDAVCGLLGVGRSSRLRKSLQTRLGIVSDVGAGIVANRDNGIATVRASLTGDDLRGVVRGVFREVGRLARGDVEPSEMEKNLRRLEASYVLEHETSETQASTLGLFETFGDYRYAETYIDRLAGVTIEDVARVASTYLVPGNATVVSYSPEGAGLGEGDISDEATEAALEGLSAAAGTELAERRSVWSPPSVLSRPAMVAERAEPSLRSLSLSCGAPLVVFESHSLPTAAVALAFKGGHVCEPARSSGVTYLTQRMLMRGTAERSADELADDIESLGGAAAPIVDRDGFGLGMSVPSDRLNEGLSLLGEILSRPSLPEEQLEAVRTEVIAEIGEAEDHPFRRVTLMLLPALFPEHPYGRPVRGYRETAAGLSHGDVQDWHRTRYSNSNLVVCVAGDVDPDRVRERLDALAASLPTAPASNVDVPVTRAPDASAVSAAGRPGQATIAVGFGGPPAGTRDATALRLVARALSMMGGRLWVALRERPPHAYTVSSSLASFRNGGAFLTYVTAAPGQEDAAVEAILREFELLCADGLGEEEAVRAKNFYCGTHMISLQRSFTRAASYATAETMGVGHRRVDLLPEEIRSLTNEELISACRRHLSRDSGFATAILRGD